MVEPSKGLAQIRLFNTVNCNADLNIFDQNSPLNALEMYQNLTVTVTGNAKIKFTANYKNCQYFTNKTSIGIIKLYQDFVKLHNFQFD